MLKMLLLTQIYFNDGSHHFMTFSVLVHDKQECQTMGLQIINRAIEIKNLAPHVHQVGVACTDEVQELSFWPIPKNVPKPKILR